MSPTGAGESTALSRELADFLIEFSIALHKNAIYPEGHPLLSQAVRGLLSRMGALLKDDRATLSIGVARRQLIIEGVATDPNHPLLRELAQRLHRHQLGAVRFSAGIANDELQDFLATVAVDASRMDLPLGLGDFMQHRLETLLELTAILRPRDERAHVQRDDTAVLQTLGDILLDDAPGQSLLRGRVPEGEPNCFGHASPIMYFGIPFCQNLVTAEETEHPRRVAGASGVFEQEGKMQVVALRFP